MVIIHSIQFNSVHSIPFHSDMDMMMVNWLETVPLAWDGYSPTSATHLHSVSVVEEKQKHILAFGRKHFYLKRHVPSSMTMVHGILCIFPSISHLSMRDRRGGKWNGLDSETMIDT